MFKEMNHTYHQKNIDEAIRRHREDFYKMNLMFTTLHQETRDVDYISDSSSVKCVINKQNHVMYYSRSIIPSNKTGIVNPEYTYKIFTGVYVYEKGMLNRLSTIEHTELQTEEDVEQLNILESGFIISSYPTIEDNERSVNTPGDYTYLCSKYNIESFSGSSHNKSVVYLTYSFR